MNNKWRIDYSRDAEKFIKTHGILEEVGEELKKFLIKIRGGNVNVDLKKLVGDWEGYYRLRKGKLRVIFAMDKNKRILFVERIDFRGDVYK
jgi:mRNA interferase RelE/StbE